MKSAGTKTTGAFVTADVEETEVYLFLGNGAGDEGEGGFPREVGGGVRAIRSPEFRK